MQPSEFQATLRRAQSGDRTAMDELLASVRPYLETVARDHVRADDGVESASDLVQETELRAWQKLEQFSGGASDAETAALFRGWIAQIARRLSLDGHRNRNTQRRAPERPIVSLDAVPGGESSAGVRREPASSESTPSAKARAREGATAIQAALESLADPTDQEIVRLYFFDALSLQQISDRLGISYDRVKDRYRKSMSSLERRLRDLS